MVERAPGVFVSSTSTQEWAPDPEVPGSEAHVLVESDGLAAGMSRFAGSVEPITWTPERREVAFIREGTVRIETAGQTLELGPGDLFSLPPGVETTWHVSTPFKEVWVLGID